MNFVVIKRDITEMDVDAIVLPANEKLRIGRGCSSAIYKKAGEEKLKKACASIDKSKLKIGDAVKTLGYDLEAEIIIHAVVPKWNDGKCLALDKLKMTYESSLKLADSEGCQSLAIPLLGAGNNGFEAKKSYYMAEDVIRQYIPQKKLKNIYLVVYDSNSIKELRGINVSIENCV